MCSGPSTGAALFKHARRTFAVTATLSLLTLGLSVPPTAASITAAAAPDEVAAAVSFDYAAESRELDALDRATRNARADAAVKTGLGSVEVTTPKAATATKKTPPKKQPATTRAAGGSTGKAAGKTADRKPARPVAATGGAAKVIAFLRARIGEPYRWGAAGPSAWDCSGLTQQAMAQVGIKLPHQSEQQARYGRVVPRSQTRAGDLLHWRGHVAIAVSSTRMIHASRAGQPVKEVAIYGSPTVRRLIG